MVNKVTFKKFPKIPQWAKNLESKAFREFDEWRGDTVEKLEKLCYGCQHNAYINGSNSQTPLSCNMEFCVRLHPKEFLEALK